MCESSISDPMSFLYLDMLSNILIDEVVEIGKEFDNKMNFIREQERRCLENAQHLISIDQFIKTMNECIFKTELELEENENNLLEAEKFISRYEASYIDFSKGPELIRLRPSNYLVFLKLLLSADRSAAQCNNLRKELDLYNNEASKRLESSKLISKIMDCHIQALNSLEKQLDQMQSLANNVTKSYDDITAKLKISSLSTKCTCEMAKIINNVCLR